MYNNIFNYIGIPNEDSEPFPKENNYPNWECQECHEPSFIETPYAVIYRNGKYDKTKVLCRKCLLEFLEENQPRPIAFAKIATNISRADFTHLEYRLGKSMEDTFAKRALVKNQLKVQ